MDNQYALYAGTTFNSMRHIFLSPQWPKHQIQRHWSNMRGARDIGYGRRARLTKNDSRHRRKFWPGLFRRRTRASYMIS